MFRPFNPTIQTKVAVISIYSLKWAYIIEEFTRDSYYRLVGILFLFNGHALREVSGLINI